MSNEVAKIDEKGVFVIPAMSERAQTQLAGIKLEYPVLKIPTGGQLYFEIDEEPEKEIMGVIVHHGPRRMYYATEFDGSNNPPDCSSNDGITGYARTDEVSGDGEAEFETRSCAECPYNEFGSDRNGAGKACKEKHQLYILLSDKLIPYSFVLPVSSTKVLNSYATKLFNKGQYLDEVLTSFSLEKATSRSNIVYSRLVLKTVRRLTPEEYAMTSARGEQVKADVNYG